jgi:hypothetical protein
MTEQPDRSNVDVAPRTVEGRCSCDYCTAIREGELEPVADRPSAWAQRMGATSDVYVEIDG